ncbi:Gfo/Idh/MocA family protein [Saccharopolyspora spinosporotrichia]
MTARRIAVVGLGVISRFYLAAIESSRAWELAAVCDVRDAALDPHRGTVACYADHRTMMAQAQLDAVVVTVPNDAHGAICRDALLAGLAVCVEKPLTLSAAEGRELDALARMREVALLTAFHRRYNRNVRALLARQRATGTPIRSMTVRYLELIEEHIGQDTWYLDAARCGGGCVADNGPNAFDLVRLFLGDAEVVESEITRDGTGTDRQARIALRSGTGVDAVVELDWSHPGRPRTSNSSWTTVRRCAPTCWKATPSSSPRSGTSTRASSTTSPTPSRHPAPATAASRHWSWSKPHTAPNGRAPH